MPDQPTKIAILAAAGTGLAMAETIARCEAFTFVGFLDDDPAKQADGYAGHRVHGPLAAWSDLPDDWQFLSSLYGARRNAEFAAGVDRLAIPRERCATVVDPTAVVAPSATLESGVFVGPLCVVEPEARLGSWSALLGSVHLAHHVRLGAYAVCANSVAVCGGVEIGEAAFVGAGAAVREYTRIGPRAVVGLGSIVVDDVAAETIVAGNPASPLP